MIDVVMVNYDSPKETEQSIEAYLAGDKNIRIILVNNGIPFKPLIKSRRIKIVDLKHNYGQARATNIGLDATESEYVCCCHNDIIIRDKGWVSKNVEFLKESGAGLVDAMGWANAGGRIRRISSLDYQIGDKKVHKMHIKPKGFYEVQRTDEFTNTFKNDGIRADERYLKTCLGIWIDILGRGKKLYVSEIKDGVHLPKKSSYPQKEVIGGKMIAKRSLRKYYQKNRLEVRVHKLKENGLIKKNPEEIYFA